MRPSSSRIRSMSREVRSSFPRVRSASTTSRVPISKCPAMSSMGRSGSTPKASISNSVVRAKLMTAFICLETL